MPSEPDLPTPFDSVARVADPIMAVFEDADDDVDIMYCIGIAPWADGGESLVAITFSTSRGNVWVVVDRFESCWLVMHRCGMAGVARTIPVDGDVDDLVEECCRFLGGLDVAPQLGP